MAITIQHIAEEAGVSKRTVSRVLNDSPYVNEKTRLKIKRIIQKKGYNVNILAKNLAKGQAVDLVGLITNIEDLFGKCYFTKIIQSIENHLEKNGHSLFIINLLDSPNTDIQSKLKTISSFYHSNLIKGLILLAPAYDDKRINILNNHNVKGIIIGSKTQCKNFGYIDVDNKEGVFQMISYMIEKEHKKIAIVNGPSHLSSAIERKKAFIQIMKSNNMIINEQYIVDSTYTREGGRMAAKRLFSLNERPSAIFCANDDMALGIYDEALDQGIRIPEDIAVGGFDNLDISEDLKPSLSTIAQPFSKIGEIAAESMINQNFNIKMEIPVTFIKRESI